MASSSATSYDAVLSQMDDRHRWMVSKLKESLEESAPTDAIDDFLCARDTMPSIATFLSGRGPPRLVVGCRDVTPAVERAFNDNPPVVLVRVIQGTFPPNLIKVVYFNRHSRVENRPIGSPADMLFGELSTAMLADLRMNITDVCVPLIESASSWGVCSPRNIEAFKHNVDKFVGSLPAVASASDSQPLPMPDESLVRELKPGALVGTVKQNIVAAAESLIEEWASTIEEVLVESRQNRGGADDGPRGDGKFWCLRLRTLKAFFEQLKMPECSAVVTVLMNSQSKQSKRWRMVDAGLTAAIAETKDAVKLLEALDPFFEELYNGTPRSVTDAMPVLSGASKLFTACARHEGASMFFISLFQRISTQVTTVCNESVSTQDDGNVLWSAPANHAKAEGLLKECLALRDQYMDCLQQIILKHQTVFTERWKQQTRFEHEKSSQNMNIDAVLQYVVRFFDAACKRLADVANLLATRKQYNQLAYALLDLPVGITRSHLLSSVTAIDTTLVSKPSLDLKSSPREFGRVYERFLKLATDQDNEIKELIASLSDVDALTTAERDIVNSQSAFKRAQALKRFEPVESRPEIGRILNDALTTVFSLFDSEVQDVYRTFQERRADPPRTRDAPPSAGAIIWVRALMARIEQPMMLFKGTPVVMASPGAPQTIKLYNKVATALVKHESGVFREWKGRIQAARDGLMVNLLARGEDRFDLQINMEPALHELVRETEWLVRARFTVPESAREVLRSQQKLGLFVDGLAHALEEYRRVLKTVPDKVLPMLSFHVNALLQTFAPGVENLTWSAPDIDVFLFSVKRELAHFEEVVVACQVHVHKIRSNIESVAMLELVRFEHTAEDSDASVSLAVYTETQTSSIANGKMLITDAISVVGDSLSQLYSLTDLDRVRSKSSTPGALHQNPNLQAQLLTTAATARQASFEEVVNVFSQMMREAIDKTGREALQNVLGFFQGGSDHHGMLSVVLDIEHGLPHHTVLPNMQSVEDTVESHIRLLQQISQTSNVKIDGAVAKLLAQRKPQAAYLLPSWAQPIDNIREALQELAVSITAEIATVSKQVGSLDLDLGPQKEEFARLRRPKLDDFRHAMMSFEEKKNVIENIKPKLDVGPMTLRTQTLQYALLAELSERKSWYTNQLRDQAKANLNRITDYVATTFARFNHPVESLAELAGVMAVLQELRDFSITLDTLVVEDMYDIMLQMGVTLAREETESIAELHKETELLMERADSLRHELMVVKKSKFERLLDTEVKTFMVATIHLRNTFESSGPLSTSIAGSEAVHRLRRLEGVFTKLEQEQKVLSTVETLYGLQPTPFPEFDRTYDDLHMLARLYDLYEQFAVLNSALRVSYWTNIDLEEQRTNVKRVADAVNELPTNLHRWPAYLEMQGVSTKLLEAIPLLELLAGTAIRDRHWREVMNITGTTFSLEGLVIQTLLDLDLPIYTNKIHELARRANGEAELESTLRLVDVEWNEQVFPFSPFTTSTGDDSVSRLILDVEASQRLIDRAEDAHINMTAMMGSPSLGPHKAELVSWMAKLNEIASFLHRWLEVQELWKHLASVFSRHGDELTYEKSQFAVFDRDYTKFLIAAQECHNILHWCYGSDDDVTKIGLLENLAEGLEGCRKSLSTFLDTKRKEFPRFNFTSDTVLLDVVSKGIGRDSRNALPSTLRALFSNISHLHLSNNSIVEIESAEGEELLLNDPIPALETTNLAELLSRLVKNVRVTLSAQIAVAADCVSTIHQKSKYSDIDTIVSFCTSGNKFTSSQVSRVFLRLFWTQMTSRAIERVKLHRHAYMDAKDVMDSLIAKFTSDLTRKLPIRHNNRVAANKLQGLVTLALHLRENSDTVASSRCKDLNDFGWLRHCRYMYEEGAEDMDLFADDSVDSNEGLKVCFFGKSIDYAGEFFGAKPELFITPATARYTFMLVQGMQDVSSTRGCLLVGKVSSAATRRNTICSLSDLCGKYLLETNCTTISDGTSLGRLLVGLSRDESFGCFHNIDQLSLEAMSTIAQKLQEIATVMRSKRFETKTEDSVSALSNSSVFGIFATALVRSPTTADLPDFIKTNFRSVNFAPPSKKSLITAHCLAAGIFKNPKQLADKINLVCSICEDQMKSEPWYDFTTASSLRIVSFAINIALGAKGARSRRANVSSGTPAAGRFSDKSRKDAADPSDVDSSKKETAHDLSFTNLDSTSIKFVRPPKEINYRDVDDYAAFVAFVTAYRDFLLPKHRVLFDQLLESVFAIKVEHTLAQLEAPNAFREAVCKTATENGLIPDDRWVDKVMQIHTAVCKMDAVMLIGESGSGKTTCFNGLLGALAQFGTNPRVHRINPRAVSPAQLFGSMRDNEWVDGIFPVLWRQIEKSSEENNEAPITTFIVFDGPFTQNWLAHINPIISDKGYFVLGNGDRLSIPSCVKIVFEVSPADLQRVGVHRHVLPPTGSVYIDPNLVTPEMMASVWLAGRRAAEASTLQELMDRLLGSCIDVAETEGGGIIDVPVAGRLDTMFALLTSLLADSVSAGDLLSKSHMECLFLFSVSWAFGGLLAREGRTRFHDHLKTISGLVPQDEPHHTIFDYYVTESADWITWQSEVKSLWVNGEPFCEDNGFVHTASTACMHYLMQLSAKAGKNVCVAGMRGSGRSACVEQYLMAQNSELAVTKTLTCSRVTSGTTTRNFLFRNTEKRTGSVYGAPNGKPITFFFDGVGLAPSSGEDEMCEVLRLLLEEGKWLVDADAGKNGEWRWLTDSSIIATLEPVVEYNASFDRLSRHFACFHLIERTHDNVRDIVHGQFAKGVHDMEGAITPEVQSLILKLADTSTSLLQTVREGLIAVDKKWQCTYGLADLLNVFKGLCRIPAEQVTVTRLVAAWRYEWVRVFVDKCTESADISWMLSQQTAALSAAGLIFPIGESYLGPLDALEKHLRSVHLRLSDLFAICSNGKSEFELWSPLKHDTKHISQDAFLSGLSYVKFPEELNADLVKYLFSEGSGASISFTELQAARSRQRDEFIAQRQRKEPSQSSTAEEPANSLLTGEITIPKVDVDSLPSLVVDFLEPYGQLMTAQTSRMRDTQQGYFHTHYVCDVMMQTQKHLAAFNESSHTVSRPLRLTRTLSRHFLRLGRVMAVPGCSAVMVGKNAHAMHSMSRFVAQVAGCNMHEIDCAELNTFISDMRALFRVAGCKNTRVIAYIRGDGLRAPIYERLNGFFANGDIYDLFSRSEMSALFEGLIMDVKRDGNVISVEEMFTERVRENLHIIMSFPAFDKNLKDIVNSYPEIMGRCYINFFDDGDSGPSFVERGLAFGRDTELFHPFPVHAQESIAHLLATSHLAARAMIPDKAVSPVTFESFIECFNKVYNARKKQHDAQLNRLRLAIKTCEGTREEIHGMETMLKENAVELRTAETSTTTKLSELLQAAAAAETISVEDEGVDSQDDEELLAEFVEKQKQEHVAIVRRASKVAAPKLDVKALQCGKALSDVRVWQAKITPKRTDTLRSLKNPSPLIKKVVDMVVIILRKELDTDVFSRRGKEEFVDSWKVTRNVVMNAQFQKWIEEYDPASFDSELYEFLTPYLAMEDINSKSVRRAARECYVMYEWIVRIVDLYRVSHDADGDMDYRPQTGDDASSLLGNEAKEKSIEDLNRLQEEFDQVVQDKQNLEKKRATLQSRLKLAQQLDTSFGVDVGEWKKMIPDVGTESFDVTRLLCKCAIASAYVAYTGPMPETHRVKFVSAIERAAEKCFTQSVGDVDSAFGRIELDSEEIVDLVSPLLEVHVDNWSDGDFRSWLAPHDACVVQMQAFCDRWPLIIDPLGGAERWIVNTFDAVILNHSLDSTSFVMDLRKCLIAGRHVIIKNNDLDALWSDTRIRNILTKRIELNSRLVRSVTFGHDELDYNDDFRLYIATPMREVDIPTDFVPFVSVVHSTVAAADLQESLSHYVMSKRDPEHWISIKTSYAELFKRKTESNALETRVLDLLGKTRGTDGGQTGHDGWIHEVSDVKSAAERARILLETASETHEKSMVRMAESKNVAKLVVAVLDTVTSLSRVNRSYEDIDTCFKLLDSALAQRTADTSPLDAYETMRHLVATIYTELSRGMLEMECKAFLFLLSVKTEIALGNVKETILTWFDHGLKNEASGAFDVFLRAVHNSDSRRGHPSTNRRMAKIQGSGILNGVRIDAASVPWVDPITDVMDQFSKYKSEWVGWRENKNLTVRMPHDLHDQLSDLQTLVVTGVLRPQKFVEAAEKFSRSRFGSPDAANHGNLTRAMFERHPQRSPVYMLDQGMGDDSAALVDQMARSSGASIVTVTLNGCENTQQMRAEFEAAMQKGVWYFIKCAHKNEDAYSALAQVLADVNQKDLNPQFRLWVAAHKIIGSPNHDGHFVIETPQTFRSNLTRLLAMIPQDVCESSTRPEWLILLHNICYIHCVLQSRQLFGVIGSLHQYTWSNEDLLSVINYAQQEYAPEESVGLVSVRTYMAVIYCRHIADARDKTTLYAMLDSWLGHPSLKAGYEFHVGSGSGYKAPQNLFPSRGGDRNADGRYREWLSSLSIIASSAGKLDQGRLNELAGLGSNAAVRANDAENLFSIVQKLLGRSRVDKCIKALAVAVDGRRLKSPAGARLSSVQNHAVPPGSKALGGTQFIDALNALLEKVPTRTGPRWRYDSSATRAPVSTPAVENTRSLEPSAVNTFIELEVARHDRILAFLRSDIMAMIQYLTGKGGASSPHLLVSIDSLLRNQVPATWERVSWKPRPVGSQKPLAAWTELLALRSKELEKLNDKRLKIPSTWLGGMFNPRGMLAAMRMEAMSETNPDPVMRVEITNRDYHHLREPPMDGIFVHRVALDGCLWENGGFREPAAGKRTHLPVLHITYALQAEATGRQLKEASIEGSKRRGDTVHNYSCPTYRSQDRTAEDSADLVLNLDVACDDLNAYLKWTLWGVCLTL